MNTIVRILLAIGFLLLIWWGLMNRDLKLRRAAEVVAGATVVYIAAREWRSMRAANHVDR